MFRGIVAFAALFLFVASAAAQVTGRNDGKLAQRIAHTDPARFRHMEAVHDGAGSMDFGVLLDANAVSANLLFVHRGVIAPHSGIGQHFHNKCEEMFIILDGVADFTIDGRTSRIAGPAAVPDRMGHAHAIYNPTDKPVQWMNINVGLTKAYDAFNLGDSRVGAMLDPIPQFISARFDKALLKPSPQAGVQSRRVFDPSVFATPWSYVDHVALAANASLPPAALADMSETFIVLSGEGSVTVDGETAPLHTGDVVPIDLGQKRAFHAGSNGGLEMMVIGVAKDLDAKAAYMQRGARG